MGNCKAKKKNGEPCTQIVNLVGHKPFSVCLCTVNHEEQTSGAVVVMSKGCTGGHGLSEHIVLCCEARRDGVTADRALIGCFSLQHDCEYCQYHIQAQYKKLSAKRSDLQSTFSGGRIPKKFRRGTSLKERLCQDGFYYGGVSSESFAASM